MSHPDLLVRVLIQDEGSVTVALPTNVRIWGVVCRNSGTGASSVLIYDALTATGTAKINVAANTGDGTNFEEMYGVMFPAPVKFRTGVAVDVTNADVVQIYYS